MLTRPWLSALTGLPILLSALFPASGPTPTAPAIQVVMDGRTLPVSPAPVLVDGRVLVPVRSVMNSLGAAVEWQQESRTVVVTRGDTYVRLKADSRLACLNTDCTRGATLDVPAHIIIDRTYVPIRFLSQALGYRVSWDQARKTVIIETDKAPDYSLTQVTLPDLTAGQRVNGPLSLRAAGPAGTNVQFYLINPATGAGPMIAAGSDPTGTYTFVPDPTVRGNRLIVAAIRDTNGAMRLSDPVSVVLEPTPQVRVTGIQANGLVTGPISLGVDANFVAAEAYLKLTDSVGNVTDFGVMGQGDHLTWYPQVGHNGTQTLQAIAYDRYGNEYKSAAVPIRVQTDYRTSFSGVSEGATLTGPVTLRVSGNYGIEWIRYVLDERVLGWGFNYYWNLGTELNGPHTLRVEVGDTQGTVRTLGPYHFQVAVTPQVWLSGVGPNQVVTGPITLGATSNVSLASVDYYVTDANGQWHWLGRKAPGEQLTWTPTAAYSGNRSIQAVAKDAKGNTLRSEVVSFRVYLGTIYGPQPIVAKDQFQSLASQLSVPIYEEVGMSAALQVAQSILETGWGQYAPVDKYTGKVSYNLFGIKGTGPNGSIISNTWEEYNGTVYRIDANFRAYHNVGESWRDHADLLLTKSWYAPFRAVMTDPVLGAWALRRSGYATDSQYPVKLIRIMKQQDLFKLDEIQL